MSSSSTASFLQAGRARRQSGNVYGTPCAEGERRVLPEFLAHVDARSRPETQFLVQEGQGEAWKGPAFCLWGRLRPRLTLTAPHCKPCGRPGSWRQGPPVQGRVVGVEVAQWARTWQARAGATRGRGLPAPRGVCARA